MVEVRESPHSKLSPDRNNAQWPPKSPFQALLSSPTGRKRWEKSRCRSTERSPSPSPLRKSSDAGALLQLAGMQSTEREDSEDAEDEEMLQLRLQQIEAKLKLAKLRKAKKTGIEGVGVEKEKESRRERAPSPRKRERPDLSPTRLYKAAVDVPVSPVRKTRGPVEQLSPARQRLGLTSIQRAADVSLKRARDGNQERRAQSRQISQADIPKPKSFSERLVQSKMEEEERQAKKDRLERVRSSGFSRKHPEQALAESLPRPKAVERTARLAGQMTRPASAGHAHESSSASKSNAGVARSASARDSRQLGPSRPHAKSLFNPGAYGQDSGTGHAEGDSDSSLQIEEQGADAGYDPFSKIHLKKRHIQHAVVAREMEGKEIYNLARLLKEVKSPDYDPPDCETDYIVFAILASKSSPFEHAQTHRSSDQVREEYEAPRNKFMVLHLCDLKWELDCFLFGTAFNQFWKLTPGTLLALLNPAILPPKGAKHSGRFSLKLGSSEDAVMEIGLARDLGYCSAIKKDGQPCGEWVNKRKTEACEFHLNLQIEKNRKGRMEVNSMFRGDSALDEGRRKRRSAQDHRGKNTGGASFHREYGQLYSVNTGMGRSAASLLDAEDTDALHNMTQEEASRKRIANAQKERDLAKQLGEMGSGVGAEYMRAKHVQGASTTTTTTLSSTESSRKESSAADEARDALFSKPSAADLGLLGKKASDARLSPAKDRKKHFGLGALSTVANNNPSAPMGWGGARKAGLLQPKESVQLSKLEHGQTTLAVETTVQSKSNLVRSRSQDSTLRSNGSSSPVKKKARFVLERGIREPGRDSLPGSNAVGTGAKESNDDDADDDDDDLDIV